MVEANADERARTRKHDAVGRGKGSLMAIVLEVQMKEKTKRIKGKEDAVYEKELQTEKRTAGTRDRQAAFGAPAIRQLVEVL
jgi:hypothetical protein